MYQPVPYENEEIKDFQNISGELPHVHDSFTTQNSNRKLISRRQSEFNIRTRPKNQQLNEITECENKLSRGKSRSVKVQNNSKSDVNSNAKKLITRRKSDFDLLVQNKNGYPRGCIFNEKTYSNVGVNGEYSKDTPADSLSSLRNNNQTMCLPVRGGDMSNGEDGGSILSIARSNRSINSKSSRGSKKQANVPKLQQSNGDISSPMENVPFRKRSQSNVSREKSSTKSKSGRSRTSSYNTNSRTNIRTENSFRVKQSYLIEDEIEAHSNKFKTRSNNSSKTSRTSALKSKIKDKLNNNNTTDKGHYHIEVDGETWSLYTESNESSKCDCCIKAFHLTIIAFVILIISSCLLSYTYVDINWIKARPPTAVLLGLSLFSFLTIGLAASKLDLMCFNRCRCNKERYKSKCCK